MAQAHTHEKFTYRRPPGAAPAAQKKPAAAIIQGPKDLWQNLQIVAVPGGPTKTTRAMKVPGGVLINTCTRGVTYAAEALVFVPGADLMSDGPMVRLVDHT